MKDENLILIVVAMLLFCALFAYINNDSHKTTWKGIDSLYSQGELLELMIKQLEKKTIVVHDTIYLPMKEINNVQN